MLWVWLLGAGVRNHAKVGLHSFPAVWVLHLGRFVVDGREDDYIFAVLPIGRCTDLAIGRELRGVDHTEKFREVAACAHGVGKLHLDLLVGADEEHGADGLVVRRSTPHGRVAVVALKHVERMRDPFEAPHPFYALIELTSLRPGGALRKTLQAVLAQAIEDGFAKDAVIATSEAQAKELWTIREDINEAQIPEGGSIKHDVSVPISRVPEFLRRATDILERAVPGGRVIAFGHVGDGNIHFNLSQPEGADTDAFMAESNRVVRGVHDLVAEMEGSFSAEHGIGLHKRDLLKHYKSDVEMDLMWTVKRSLDAKSIMNLGKLL